MSDTPNTPSGGEPPAGHGESVRAGLSDADTVSGRNEGRRTLLLLRRHIRDGAVKVWGLPDGLEEILPADVRRYQLACEKVGEYKLALLAAQVLAQMNNDNARILNAADRLELMSEALELKKGRKDPNRTPKTVLELHGNVTVGIMVQAPPATPAPPPPPPPPALGGGGAKIDLA